MRHDPVSDRGSWTRRTLLGAAVGMVGSIAWRSAAASPEELAAAVRTFAGGAPLRTGRVLLDIAPLVENGNVVPISVTVDSPMTESDHVTAIAVFNERNPQRDVAVFHLGPRAGRAMVATRIRLATSQQLLAVARMNDGSCFTHTVDVIVTLAACVES
ncbi:SoxY-related AACIE arm protein [Rhizobacter sp. Root404]|uniref:SoxY-related AACIE arm protein n=1 Tax=Rhizobacter sp. Root404 TaxID=1736528 RepID=UPI0006FCE500|nr:SoxY-related AACIE arm protein [Rhizobacter sp. Root404]KQW40019.1 sulfur oxidation protein SoxY [Rhizobacter sp. Root404]